MSLTLSSVMGLLFAASVVLYAVLLALFLRDTRRVPRPGERALDPARGGRAPGVTILKPCAGDDEALEECLESFFRLEYAGRVQLLCGVRDASDAALPTLRRALARHPGHDTAVVLTHEGQSANPKVAQLEVLERHARHALVWISDSNTRVEPDTLTGMVDAISPRDVGVVVSPVVGDGERSAGAALENLHLAAFVTLSMHALHALDGRVIAAGKSMLLRRRDLAAIGGFERLGRYVAEDHLIGRWLEARGLRVAIGPRAVVNVNARGSVRRFVQRHTRWTQLHWVLEPAGALLEPAVMPLLPALAWAIVAPARVSFLAVVFALAVHAAGDTLALRRLRGRGLAPCYLPLVALRPVLFAGLWTVALVWRRLVWRGQVRWVGRDSEALASPRLCVWRAAVWTSGRRGLLR